MSLPQEIYDTLAVGTNMILKRIETQVALLLFDDLKGTDQATDELADAFAEASFGNWSLAELRSLQIVRQAALAVLDGYDAAIGEPDDAG